MSSNKAPSKTKLEENVEDDADLPDRRPAATAAGKEGSKPSIFPYLMSVFTSPTWKEPLEAFIDEYCVLFDPEEEENQLIHAKVFDLFKDQIETLVCEHLEAVGIDLEAFIEACDRVAAEPPTAFKDEIGHQVYDYLLLLEHFDTFRQLMLKRNLELEVEAIELLLQDAQADVVPEPLTPEEETEQLQRALEASTVEDGRPSSTTPCTSQEHAASPLSSLSFSASAASSSLSPCISSSASSSARSMSFSSSLGQGLLLSPQEAPPPVPPTEASSTKGAEER